MAIPVWLKEKLYLKREMRKSLPGVLKGEVCLHRTSRKPRIERFLPQPF
jgi:hypothetical protein